MRKLLAAAALLAAFGVACGTEDDGVEGAGGNGGGGGGGSGGQGGEACVPAAGAPIEVPEATWTWVEIEGSVCRDGTPTGVGVYRRPGASRLVIYLEGGGACFNQLSCLQNRENFGEEDFAGLTLDGILDVDDAANPLGEASFVYVPYCTGDVHGGSAEGVDISRGPQDQMFVGHDNVGRALQRIVPTFGDVEQVVLTGTSAGGFGTLLNYEQVAEAFCSDSVVLLDDSGLPEPVPFLARCLQDRWRAIWNLDETLPQGCTECASAEGDGIVHFLGFLSESYPEGRFGYISSTRDQTIGQFFAFGLDECENLAVGLPDTARGIDTFEEGLQELLAGELAGRENVSAYVIESGEHVWLRARLHTTSVEGMDLVDWVDALVSGNLPPFVTP